MTTYDAGDEVAVKDRKTRQRLDDLEAEEVLKEILSSYKGRHFIWGLLEECRIYSATGETDSIVTYAYRDAQRNLGLKLLARCFAVDPNSYTQMRIEAEDRKKR